MLKVRIIAALVAIVLTVLTIYLVPKIAYFYTSFVGGLSHDQQTRFSIFQAILGASIAAYGLWRWRKKKGKH